VRNPPSPQASPENHAATETGDDLIALGPDIVAAGELVTVGAAEWVVRIKKFVIGDIGALVTFIDGFRASPPNDRYVIVNALGDGRSLADAPTVTTSGDAHSVGCPVAPGFPRKDVRHLNMTATSPETNDLFIENGSIARVFRRRRAAAVGAAMPVVAPLRESLQPRLRWAPCGVFPPISGNALPRGFVQAGGDPAGRHPLRQRHDRPFGNAPSLRRTRTERRTFVGYGGERAASGALRFRSQRRRPLGAGGVEKIRERGKAHAAIYGGRVVTRGMVEALTAPDTLSRVISKLR
jgi:hypothetical protein